MPADHSHEPAPEPDDRYEPPHVEDLGAFVELTQHRMILRVTDNATQFGSR